jgi:hypothetical protein
VSEYLEVMSHSSVALEFPSTAQWDYIYYDKADNRGAGSPRIPVEDARCGLKAIDNPREFRLLEIAYTHEGRE